MVLTAPWAWREGEGSRGGLGCREGSACASGPWLLLGVRTEPSPAVAQQLCRTSAPILCCVIAPPCAPLAFLCCSQPSWTGFGSLAPSQDCTGCPGLGCVVWVTSVLSRGGEAGGWWGSSVPWQGSPHSTVLTLHWQELHSHLWDPRRAGWWRRGHSVPWQLRSPGCSTGHCCSSPRLCAGCWGCPAWPVPSVCPWCSCLAGGNGCCSVPGLLCHPAVVRSGHGQTLLLLEPGLCPPAPPVPPCSSCAPPAPPVPPVFLLCPPAPHPGWQRGLCCEHGTAASPGWNVAGKEPWPLHPAQPHPIPAPTCC
ncbi:uncharacterized protein LOC107203950 [Parus major]|uniref:uncharacterized protein LOC107203950 n=1 Tax=Parus major TaxID=9157 RepID=UPI0007710952|nr:uncharacterized protein LOC107203950 [Parus major]